MKVTSLALGLSAAVNTLAKLGYEGAKAVRVSVGEDVIPLLDVITKLELSTWKGMAEGIPVANGFVDLVVPADKVSVFDELTGSFTTEIMHEDLGLAIDEESRGPAYISRRQISTDLTWWESYHPYSEHVKWLYDLQASHPQNSSIFVVGNSVEGRPITGIKIWGREGLEKRESIVLHGGVHAREWISSKTVQYIAHYILTNLETNNELRKFVNRYDFHIIPHVNPDGFSFSQTNNRLWRKNRQTVATSTCFGRDINRNWAYMWQVPGGASTNPCSETYKGLAAHDTPENTALSAHVRSLSANGIRLFIDFHSYGQYILSPYGYNCSVVPENSVQLVKAARRAADEIFAVYGTTYTYGPSCSTLYANTGSAPDYVYGVGKAKYAYTVELRDQGRFGFVLPASQIIPTVLETWVGFRHLLKDI